MMEKNVEARLKELIVLKLTNQLSEEQSKEIEELKKIPDVRLFIDRMTKEYLVKEIKIIKQFDERKSQVWDDMRPGIEFRRRVLTMWQKLAIAASFILVISICAYLFLFTEKKSNNLAKAQTNNSHEIFAPDNGKAILTLANGISVLLDTAQNGLLVQQGGISVRKTDGQVQYVDLGKNEEVVYNKISTPIGGGYTLILQDGSKVFLNGNSSLKYPSSFIGSERRVEVTGEAYFVVSKSKSQPFIVTTNDVLIKVLGTTFNINTNPKSSSINTTLIEGSIRVSNKDTSVILKPGQQAQVVKMGSLKSVNNVDLYAVTAWTRNKFYFDNVSLDQAMQVLAEWYDLKVTFLGDEKKLHVTAIMSRDKTANSIFSAIERSCNVKIKIIGREVFISN